MSRHGGVQRLPDAIQARRFEVVSASGSVLARIGVDGGDYPSIKLFAADGTPRLWMRLDYAQEPSILMSDTKNRIRAEFGHQTSDTLSPEDDNWLLSFQGTGGDDNVVAAIGMKKEYPSGKYKGGFLARVERGRPLTFGPQ